MTSTVYPTALTAPLPLAAGTAMPTPVLLNSHIGPHDISPPFDTTYIRISVSGAPLAAPPLVALQAGNPGAVTTGLEVPITAISPAGSISATNSLTDGTNATDAAAVCWVQPFTNNVFLMKVFTFIPGTTYSLRITNNTGVARDFVWVVASSQADSRQPWIQIGPPTLVYNVLIGQPSALTTQSVSVANRGTGDLTITSITPALPAAFTVTGLPLTVLPNATGANIPIAFNAPATPGSVAAAAFAFNGDSSLTFGAGHNRAVTLSAQTQALEIALMLDDSGSMSWEPDGDPLPAGSPNSRWSALATGANEFLTLLSIFGADRGRFGVSRFPRTDQTNPATWDIVPPTSPIPGNMAPTQGQVSALLPFFAGTPIGDGLQRVVNGAPVYFSSLTNRRWILLMSDGSNNSSTIDPRSFIAPAFGGTAALGTSLADKKIKVFSVGYGIDGSSDVDLDLLGDLAAGSDGGGAMQSVNAATPVSPMALAKAFRAAITSGLVTAFSATDPGGTLRPGATEAHHQVTITPYDTKVAFVLNWTTADPQRMRLQLLTPTCDLITPASGGPDFGKGAIGFDGASRYQIYRIDGDYLRNAAQPTRPRYGTWTLIVSSDELADGQHIGQHEDYEYEVIVESRLQMDVRFDQPVYYAGDPIGLSAKLTVDGVPITGAAVTVALTAPGRSFNNWLADVQVTAEELKQAGVKLAEKTRRDTNMLAVKAFAAQQKGQTFKRAPTKTTFTLTDPTNQGLYTGTFSQTSVPETYTLYVTAVGITADGIAFRREQQVQTRVGVRPDPAYTLVDVQYQLLNQQNVTAVVRVTPRDRFGNVLLLDPAANPGIVVTAKGAQFTDTFATEFDGSYTRTLVYQADTAPQLGLRINGRAFRKPMPLAPIAQLRYANDIIAYTPGVEGRKGVNLHANPKAGLGHIFEKDPQTFVSLGAHGSLAVSYQKELILAQGEDDVTIFVDPQGAVRPYLVEALAVDKDVWVALGTSPGTTQSFSLLRAKLKAARAIRITDKSGYTRDANLRPSSAPGVCIKAIGFKKTSPGLTN